MDILSDVQLADVNGQPRVKISGLPYPLRVGDPLRLKFRIERTTNGRLEVLRVNGDFRITSVSFDASTLPRKQLLSVESLGKLPTWLSMRKPSEKRRLAPAKSPPQNI